MGLGCLGVDFFLFCKFVLEEVGWGEVGFDYLWSLPKEF